MNENVDRGMSTLVIFIISAALLSAAQSVVTTGLAEIMADFHVTSTQHNGFIQPFCLF